MAEMLIETLWRVKMLKENQELRAAVKNLANKIEATPGEADDWRNALQRHKTEHNDQLLLLKTDMEQLLNSNITQHAEELQQIRTLLGREVGADLRATVSLLENKQADLLKQFNESKSRLDTASEAEKQVKFIHTSISEKVDTLQRILRRDLIEQLDTLLKDAIKKVEQDTEADINTLKSAMEKNINTFQTKHGQQLQQLQDSVNKIDADKSHELILQTSSGVKGLKIELQRLKEHTQQDITSIRASAIDEVRHLQNEIKAETASLMKTELLQIRKKQDVNAKIDLELCKKETEELVRGIKEQFAQSLQSFIDTFEMQMRALSDACFKDQTSNDWISQRFIDLENNLLHHKENIKDMVEQAIVSVTKRTSLELEKMHLEHVQVRKTIDQLLRIQKEQENRFIPVSDRQYPGSLPTNNVLLLPSSAKSGQGDSIINRDFKKNETPQNKAVRRSPRWLESLPKRPRLYRAAKKELTY